MILVYPLNKNRVFYWGRNRMLESLTDLLNVEDVTAALAFYN